MRFGLTDQPAGAWLLAIFDEDQAPDGEWSSEPKASIGYTPSADEGLTAA